MSSDWQRDVLKQLKRGFDSSFIDYTIEQQLILSVIKRMAEYPAELCHQVARRRERRGDYKGAVELFKLSEKLFDENPLGMARMYRDWGIMEIAKGDEKRGFELLREALHFHDLDIDNKKGEIQTLITNTTLWRAQIIANTDDAAAAKSHLLQLVNNSEFDDFPIEDRKIIVAFLVENTVGIVRISVRAKQLAIDAERSRWKDAAISSAQLAFDINLSIVSKAMRTILRKE